jgi:hypothetical protein
MRKLASVQKIVSLTPIVGADKIEKATVLGWDVVVKKGDFKVGDYCVYCEIDSVLPDKPEFEFLRDRKFRIKTVKLKGQVSQGICFPLDILPKQYFSNGLRKKTGNEGDDVTELLGITKHDPQAVLEQKESDRIALITKNRFKKFFMRYPWYRRFIFKPIRIPFPAWIRKTDEHRIQLFPHICEHHKDTVFSATEKLDGTSVTYFVIKNNLKWQFWKPYLFGVCSRNFQLTKPDNQPYWQVAEDMNIQQRLINLAKLYNSRSIVLQGEIIGEKIQGNKYHVSRELYLFNVIIDGVQLDNDKANRWSWNEGFLFVPILNHEFKLPSTIKEAVEMAKGNSVISTTIREGLVLRNYEKNVSFKIINPDFLLRYDE